MLNRDLVICGTSRHHTCHVHVGIESRSLTLRMDGIYPFTHRQFSPLSYSPYPINTYVIPLYPDRLEFTVKLTKDSFCFHFKHCASFIIINVLQCVNAYVCCIRKHFVRSLLQFTRPPTLQTTNHQPSNTRSPPSHHSRRALIACQANTHTHTTPPIYSYTDDA